MAFVGVDFDRRAELYVKPARGPIRQLGRVQEGWNDIELASPTIFRVKSEAGRLIEAALMKPPPSAAKLPGKSPLVLLVHGGPNANFSAAYYWFGAWAQTPTLIVHGDAERNNPVGQSKALYRALKRIGVETELVIYPGEPHSIRRAKNQIDILERMLSWFDAHLKR